MKIEIKAKHLNTRIGAELPDCIENFEGSVEPITTDENAIVFKLVIATPCIAELHSTFNKMYGDNCAFRELWLEPTMHVTSPVLPQSVLNQASIQIGISKVGLNTYDVHLMVQFHDKLDEVTVWDLPDEFVNSVIY